MENKRHHEWIWLQQESNHQSSLPPLCIQIPIRKAKNLFHNGKMTISFGKQKLEVVVDMHHYHNPFYICSSDIYTTLRLPKGAPLKAMYCKKNHTITIGPIMGVLTDSKTLNGRSFSTIDNFCRELTEVGKKKGLFTFIYSYHTLKNKQYYGYYFANEHWHRIRSVKPHFLYNRIHSRNIIHSATYKRFVQYINKQIPQFNKRFFSKQELYDFIDAFPLVNYLPKGTRWNKDNFHQFLHTYNAFLAKPVYGSQGRGIFRITKTRNNIIIETFTKDFKKFANENDAWNFLQNKLKTDYILQEELSLLSINGKLIDFRVLTHLQPNHQWKVTSVTARVSDNHFMTNLSRGGTTASAKKILLQLFEKDKALFIYQLMEELAIAVSCQLDRKRENTFIELGIDIAVLKDGKLKIIEVNSKPSKNEHRNFKGVRPSAKAIVEIARAKGMEWMEETCPCKVLESSH